MASGAKLSDQVKKIVHEMRVVKGGCDRLRLVTFGFVDGCIDVKECFRNSQLEGTDVFDFFKKKLEPKQCCYLLYDCHFQISDSRTKEELVFVMWCPEEGCLKDKMNFCASKEVIKSVLSGVKYNLEMHCPDDCSCREDFAEKMGKGENVTSLEGIAVKHPQQHPQQHPEQHPEQHPQQPCQQRRM